MDHDDVDTILSTPLNMDDPNALRQEIQKARAAETKAKTQIYTLRGKKGLQAMAAAMGEELPPQLSETSVYDDPEDSPQIQELRRQIALIREMEKQQREQIEELRRKKAEREARNSSPQQRDMVDMPRVHQASVGSTSSLPVQQASSISLQKQESVPSYATPAPAPTPSYAQPVAPASPAPAPTPVAVPAVSPAASSPAVAISPRSAGSPLVSSKGPGVTRGKGNKVTMLAPDSIDIKVLNCSWDSGASKSKKGNKAYTIQVTMNGVTWKIIRGDESLIELSKRLAKAKAEGSPLPPLVKKIVKQNQQGELAASVQTYLNQIQTSVAFAPKKDKTRGAFLKFFAPFTSRDEGMGNYPGGTSDPEGWFIWKLGLGD